MSSALSVAKALVELSFEGEEADPLTNLRLQKLLYYAQAWSLVIRQSELFQEDLRAWRHGPVVVEVCHALPGNQGSKQIAQDAFAVAPGLIAEEAEFVRRVWDVYKMFTAYKLRDMTHQETPWKKAWGDRPADGFGDDEISVGDIEEYFSGQTMQAPLAAYEHEYRKAEERARAAVADRPPLDVARFAALATSSSRSTGR